VFDSPPLFVAPPNERGVEGNAVNPSAFLRLPAKGRQRRPELQQDLLQQILLILLRRGESANHLPHQAGVLGDPTPKYPFSILIGRTMCLQSVK
jgi:hypothetical protein